MRKSDFENFLRSNLKQLPLEEQEMLLKKIRYDWLPDILNKFEIRMRKSYIRCSNCQKYLLKNKFPIEVKEEKEYGVLVYKDAGYGDDDEFADVTYKKFYYVCPLCGKLTLREKYAIRTENRRSRR